MPAPYQGGCLCGAIRYEVTSEPIAAALCHCRDCQYVSGGEPAAVVLVARNALTITRGKPKGYTVKGDSGGNVTRQFCETCGTPLFSDIESNPAVWALKAGSLDDPSWVKPGVIVYASSAQPWAHMDPALPQFPKMPG